MAAATEEVVEVVEVVLDELVVVEVGAGGVGFLVAPETILQRPWERNQASISPAQAG